MLKSFTLAIALLAAAPASAQTFDVNRMIALGSEVAQYVDKGNTESLWNGFSPVIKNMSRKDDFIANVARARKPLGAPVSRQWISAAQILVPANDKILPAGQYLSVTFKTTFASGKAGTEQISFHIDSDNVWRCTGYSLS
jgi:hypothetical protein